MRVELNFQFMEQLPGGGDVRDVEPVHDDDAGAVNRGAAGWRAAWRSRPWACLLLCLVGSGKRGGSIPVAFGDGDAVGCTRDPTRTDGRSKGLVGRWR